MDTWIYLGAALLGTGVTAIALTAIAVTGSGKASFDRLIAAPRWARAKGVTTVALGGADAVEHISQSDMHKPVSVRPPKASLRPRGRPKP